MMSQKIDAASTSKRTPKNIKRNCLCQSGYGLRNNRGCPHLRRRRGGKKETEADQYSHFLSKQDKGGSEKDNNLQSSYFYNDISS